MLRAISTDDADAVRQPSQQGADGNTRTRPRELGMDAAPRRRRSISVVRVVLENGAEVNAETIQRETPSSLAWSSQPLKELLARPGGRVAGLLPAQ